MRGKFVVAAAAAVLACSAAPAAAAEPPAGAIGNVEFVKNLPEMKWATAINFIQYGEQDVMFATGRFGLRSYDVSDPENPVFLDSVENEALRLQGDPPVDTTEDADGISTYWQNEDMDVDADRGLVFLARDPRSFKGTTASDTSIAGVYIVNAADPEEPRDDDVPPAADRPYHDVHQRLRLPLDGRPRVVERAEATARRTGPAAGRSS